MQAAPDFNALEVGNKGVFKLQGNGIAVVPLSLTIPEKPELKGKTLFYMVRAEILEQEVPTTIYFRLAVKTRN